VIVGDTWLYLGQFLMHFLMHLVLATMAPQGIFEKKLGIFLAHNPKVASSNLAPATKLNN
jgi:hypothetical protein